MPFSSSRRSVTYLLKFSSVIFIFPSPRRWLENTSSDATCKIPCVNLFIKIGLLHDHEWVQSLFFCFSVDFGVVGLRSVKMVGLMMNTGSWVGDVSTVSQAWLLLWLDLFFLTLLSCFLSLVYLVFSEPNLWLHWMLWRVWWCLFSKLGISPVWMGDWAMQVTGELDESGALQKRG